MSRGGSGSRMVMPYWLAILPAQPNLQKSGTGPSPLER
jgi:hypothetical protein